VGRLSLGHRRYWTGLGDNARRLEPLDDVADGHLYSARIWCNLITMKQPVVCCSPEVMGGTAVFYGTRVPVQTLLDYIEAGDTIDDFLEGFPSVSREQVIAFLQAAKDRLIETVS
jgi:uncharacterized protein (DUF433 family)